MVVAVRFLRKGGDATGGFFDFGRRPPTAGKRQKCDSSGSRLNKKDKNKDEGLSDIKLIG